jgi:hypothetical protein
MTVPDPALFQPLENPRCVARRPVSLSLPDSAASTEVDSTRFGEINIRSAFTGQETHAVSGD